MRHRQSFQYPDTAELIKQRILRDGNFDLTEKKGEILLNRHRKIPARGLLRLLIPRVQLTARFHPGEVRYKIRPDLLAGFLLTVFVATVIIELMLDREKFPRNYPPEFVYAIFVYFSSLLVFEYKKVKRLFEDILKNKH